MALSRLRLDLLLMKDYQFIIPWTKLYMKMDFNEKLSIYFLVEWPTRIWSSYQLSAKWLNLCLSFHLTLG